MLINRRKALGHVYQGPALALTAALAGAGGLAQHEAQRKARHKQEEAAQKAQRQAAESAAQSAREASQAVQRDAAAAEAERLKQDAAQEDTSVTVATGEASGESRRKKRQQFSVGSDSLQSVSI